MCPGVEYEIFQFLQAISVESQDSIFGQENSVAATQNSSQAQLPEPENKLDDSIDNQQQVCLVSGPQIKSAFCIIFYTGDVLFCLYLHRPRSRS